jgi:hypothetical protein
MSRIMYLVTRDHDGPAGGADTRARSPDLLRFSASLTMYYSTRTGVGPYLLESLGLRDKPARGGGIAYVNSHIRSLHPP